MTAHRGSMRHSIRLRCPADTVWDMVGAPARLTEWWEGIVSATMEGDERTIMTRSGLPMPERILTVDPQLRRFQYRITAPLFVEHLSTIDVHELGDGTCLTVYSVDAEPAVLALVIAGAARAALANLPEVLGVEEYRP
jgi:uncharacterized protein YndB with AHSA1/START domain